MSKHTPGPWASYPCALEAYSRVITAKGCMVQIARTGVRGELAMTKEVYGDRVTYPPGEETDANAKLIVAAPDLLAACYAVLHDCDDLDMVESNEPGREKGPWQMLNEAIAKAEGKP